MDSQKVTGGGMEVERMDSRGQQRKRLKITHNRQSKGESWDGKNKGRNPFLIDLVLEKVFSYSKHLDPDNFKSYRLVCKLWDAEILKLLRPDIKMNVSRIITPYPEGLGWTDDESGAGSGYRTPYPFQNVVVTGTCENLMDPQLARWFESMGSKVKQLQFTSRLTCYHHVRFLECVLKNWCPNLTQLSLAGVECISTLVNESGFVDPGDNICTNLNELILSVETRAAWKMFNNDCGEHLSQIYLNQDGLDLERCRRAGQRHGTPLGLAFMNMMCDTGPVSDYLGSYDDTAFARMRNYEMENGGSLLSLRQHLAVQQVLRSTDGGVLGKLLNSEPVSNLVLRKLGARLIRQDLIALLYCRLNNLRQTLRELTIWDDDAYGGVIALRMIRLIPYSLVTLKIGPLVEHTIWAELFHFVGSFSETLEHLEIKGKIISERIGDYGILKLPLLPNLKTFLNEDALGYRLTDFQFVGNIPNLERCEMLIQSNSNQDAVEMTREMFDRSTIEGEVRAHPLKALKMNLPISMRDHMELVANWFPGLVKVDLMLIGGAVVGTFFRITNHLPLKDVKVSFKLSDNGGSDDVENAIVETMEKKEKLQFLQLVHLLDWPAPFSDRVFELGFSKAPKLTSLKLTNVQILSNKHRVRVHDWLSHISCVQLTKVTFLWRQEFDELDFSVGRSSFLTVSPSPFPL